MKRRIDSKYEIEVEIAGGSEVEPIINIRNVYNGNEIPEDEPLFILRGRDNLSVSALICYYHLCKANNATIEHLDSLITTITAYTKWQHDNPDKMKQPGSTMTEDIKRLSEAKK